MYNVLLTGFRGNPLLLPALLRLLEDEPVAVIDVWVLLSLAGNVMPSLHDGWQFIYYVIIRSRYCLRTVCAGQGVQSNKIIAVIAKKLSGEHGAPTREVAQRAVWGFAQSLEPAFAPLLRCAQLALGSASRLGAFSASGLVIEATRFGGELYYILYMGFTSALHR